MSSCSFVSDISLLLVPLVAAGISTGGRPCILGELEGLSSGEEDRNVYPYGKKISTIIRIIE
jgi:hypothetical protein